MEFYSYLWLREDGLPYYAGKGKGRRAFVSHGRIQPPKDHSRILVFPHETETEAFESEIAFIKWFGRKDLGTGCLRNLTDGGENPPKAKKGRTYSPEGLRHIQVANSTRLIGKRGSDTPHFGCVHSEETRRKMSKPRSHSWTLSEETKKNQSAAAILREAKKKEQGIHRGQVLGYKHTDEAKQKMSAAKKGIPQTAEHIAKLSAVRKGKKWSAARRQRYEEKKNAKF